MCGVVWCGCGCGCGYRAQDAPEPHNHGEYFAVSFSTFMIKNTKLSITASTVIFVFDRRPVLFISFPPQTSAQTQSPNKVLPLL